MTILSSVIAPDGDRFTAVDLQNPDARWAIYSVGGGEPHLIAGIEPGESPIQWSRDGLTLYVARPDSWPARIFRLDIRTERRELWKELRPADGAGFQQIGDVTITSDGTAYAYSYLRSLSDLYLVEGLR